MNKLNTVNLFFKNKKLYAVEYASKKTTQATMNLLTGYNAHPAEYGYMLNV